MVGVFGKRALGPVVVYGLSSSTKSDAEIIVSSLQDLGQTMPVFASDRELENPRRYAGYSMLLMLGWQARDHESAILQKFRKLSAHNPIVVHGRDNNARARTQAFVHGADNYISPDCSEAEIHAKLRRLWGLAQKTQTSDAPVEVHGLEIWPNEKVVLKDGRRVQLSQRELDMLIYLAKQHPGPVTRRTLEREVFGCRADPGTNVVAVHVHRLRKKIAANGKLLRTVPGGYQLS